MVQAVIFDLFQVLFQVGSSDECRTCEQRLGLSPSGLETAMLRSPQFREAINGRVSEEDLWRDVALTVGADGAIWQELAHAFYSCVQLNQDLLVYMRTLRPQYKIALLSNATPAVYTLVTQQFRLDHEVDTIIISALLQSAKPHAEIYLAAAQRLGITPQEAVYIDDEMRFVEGARMVGMHGIQFQDTRQVIGALQTLFRSVSQE